MGTQDTIVNNSDNWPLRWLFNPFGNFCLILYYSVNPSFFTLLKVKGKWVNSSVSDINSSPRLRLPSYNPYLLAFLPSRKIDHSFTNISWAPTMGSGLEWSHTLLEVKILAPELRRFPTHTPRLYSLGLPTFPVLFLEDEKVAMYRISPLCQRLGQGFVYIILLNLHSATKHHFYPYFSGQQTALGPEG